jgi:hypothetical protein
MHPTPRHEASYGSCIGARVIPGVRLLPLAEQKMYKFKLLYSIVEVKSNEYRWLGYK